MMDDEKLRQFIDAVEKVRSERSVDAAMRLEIARELGVSDSDLAAAKASGEQDLARGEGFLRHAMLDEALRAFADAEALLPDDLRVLHGQARAQFGRSLKGERGAADRVRALARRCLELSPGHEPSYTLLKQLDPQRRARWPVFAVLGGALALAAGVGFVALRSRNASSSVGLCPSGARYCNIEIPVALTDPVPGLELVPAVLSVGPNDLRLAVSGRITHKGATELEEFVLTARLLDGAGKQIGELAVEAKPSFAPPLRSGDSAAFHKSEKVSLETRRVELIPGTPRTTQAPELYGASTPIDVQFEPAAPEHIRVAAGYRKRQVHTFSAKTAVEGVLEVENRGSGVIRGLELEVRALGPDGSRVGDPSRETVAYSHMLPMQPGERRLVRFHLYVPGTVAGERVVVTKVE